MSYREDLAKQVMDAYFRGFKYRDNFRPSWLEGLEMDRFYPDLGFGIEFQGEQHYRPVPGMHKNEEAFRRGVQNDSTKRRLMAQYGYQLYAIDMLSLDEFGLKGLIQTMITNAKHFATAKGYTIALTKLQTIRYDLPLPVEMRDRVNKLSYQKNRQYWNKSRQKPFLVKFLKAVFWPERK